MKMKKDIFKSWLNMIINSTYGISPLNHPMYNPKQAEKVMKHAAYMLRELENKTKDI